MYVLADPLAEAYYRAGSSWMSADVKAGKDIVRLLRKLVAEPASFIHETNLADGHVDRIIPKLRAAGYDIEIRFIGLRRPDVAVARVEQRARNGGRAVAKDIVHRRWAAGLQRFIQRSRFEADRWALFDNQDAPFVLVAQGARGLET